MGSKNNNAPKAPDYANLARTDAEEQRKTAEQITASNRPNQTDRFGNQLTWTQGPNGQWSQNVTLSPEEQYRQNAALYAQSQGLNLAMNQPGFKYDQLGYSQPGRADIGFGNASMSQGQPSGKGAVAPSGGGGQAAPVSGKGQQQAAAPISGKGQQQAAAPQQSLGAASGSKWGAGANGGFVWHGAGPAPNMTKDQILNDMGFMSAVGGWDPSGRGSDFSNFDFAAGYRPGGQGVQGGQGGQSGQGGQGSQSSQFVNQNGQYPSPGQQGMFPGQSQGSLGAWGNMSPNFNQNINFGGASGGGGDGGGIGQFGGNYGEIGNFDRSQGDRVAADYYESIMGRARPEQARQSEALDARLRNQGLQPGTEAYDRAMRNMLTAHGDVATKAGLDSTMAGYNSAMDIYNTNLGGQGQRFDQGLSGYMADLQRQGQLANQGLARDQLNQQGKIASEQANLARNQLGLQGAIADKNAQLGFGNLGLGYGGLAQQYAQLGQQGNIASEAAALARAQQQQSEQGQRFSQNYQSYLLPFQQAQYMQQMGQNAMNPLDFQGFSGATGYNPASMSDAAQNRYNAQMGGYNANQSKKGNLLGAGTTLGAAAISDVALKEDIRPLVGEDALNAILELGGYSYAWKSNGERDIGLIAQQVQEALPHLVTHTKEGHLAVYYTGVVAIAVEAIKYLAERLNDK